MLSYAVLTINKYEKSISTSSYKEEKTLSYFYTASLGTLVRVNEQYCFLVHLYAYGYACEVSIRKKNVFVVLLH